MRRISRKGWLALLALISISGNVIAAPPLASDESAGSVADAAAAEPKAPAGKADPSLPGPSTLGGGGSIGATAEPKPISGPPAGGVGGSGLSGAGSSSSGAAPGGAPGSPGGGGRSGPAPSALASPPATGGPSAGSPIVPGGPPGTTPGGLSGMPGQATMLADLLVRAMSRNPDILVADAKLRSAQAELDRARLDVARQVIDTLQSIRHLEKVVEIAKKQVDVARETRAMVKQLFDSGTAPVAEVSKAETAVRDAELAHVKAEADLQTARALLEYLAGGQGMGGGLGMGTGMPGLMGGSGGMIGSLMDVELGAGVGGSVGQGDAAGVRGQNGGGSSPKPSPILRESRGRSASGEGAGAALDPFGGGMQPASKRESVQEKLRRVMAEPTTIELVQSTVGDAMSYLNDLHGIANITIDERKPDGEAVGEAALTLNLRDVPLGAALKAIEDRTPVKFYVMDYGLRVTAKNEKKVIEGTPLREFLAPQATRGGAAYGGLFDQTLGGGSSFGGAAPANVGGTGGSGEHPAGGDAKPKPSPSKKASR